MREAAFVERNKTKWTEIEHNLKNKLEIHPDILASNYIELTNDLAYAQTFYPESKTKEYLNELAIFAHQSIYRDQKIHKNSIQHFFAYEVPKAVFLSRRPLFYSFLIFYFFVLIGWLSSHYDEGFVRLILGNFYVDETLANIAKGDPAAIYNSSDEISSTLGITINNVQVAFYAFIAGIFLSVGTGYILMQNGIMLGAFHYLFYEQGVLGKAMSAIWIHGTIEISVIIIAGGCGLMVGNSYLFPGTYKRIDSFILHLKRAAIILISTVPFFIVAGTLEGFVTRHYDINLFLSLTIILLSILLIGYYYLILPYLLAKRNAWT